VHAEDGAKALQPRQWLQDGIAKPHWGCTPASFGTLWLACLDRNASGKNSVNRP
jgi:hypothetical protein